MTPAEDLRARGAKPRLYLVATSHLDSQWRWTIRTTIRHFLKRTLVDNFERMRAFPGYVLSFEGAFRYQLAEEHFPKDFQTLVELVRRKRWVPAGAMLDAPDTNIPSPESLIRHLLYGNDYFEAKFGHRCMDIFLPDCFGFPWSLPTIAAHCGIKGFSSQKHIRWMAPAKLPFDLGVWEGPDGSRVIAVLDPGGYGKPLREDLSRSETWKQRLDAKRRSTGVAVGYQYFGLGDRGGAPDETSLDYLEASLAGEGDIEVIHAGSDQLFRDLSPEELDLLPVHRGDLLLPTHGTGCWTSHKVLKQWNRRCELLAEAAERASLAAHWLGAESYPADDLRHEWTRFLWHQMHDDLTGTSSPEAYRFTWNDLLLAQNRLSSILATGVSGAARGLDTRSDGEAIVVFNSLEFPREDVVDAWVRFESGVPPAVEVVDPEGNSVPCQELERVGRKLRLLFVASAPPVGLVVYHVLASSRVSSSRPTSLEITESSLENGRYRVAIGAGGAIESIYDKERERELLSEPADIRLLPDRSSRWPAWEIRYEDVCAQARAIAGPAETRVVERGPVRVKLEVTRAAEGGVFRQYLSLADGQAGSRLEIEHDIEWRCPGRLLKAVFPFALDESEAVATYDMGLGSIEREINTREQYEVPAHEWADLSDKDCGVSIASRDNYGWDRPDATTLRLSLLRSPKALRRFAHQATQDFGRHRLSYALFAHGEASLADISARAAGFDQPLRAFRAVGHSGRLGRRFSLLRLEGPARLMALKKAERSDAWLARIRETAGTKDSAVELATAGPITEAHETDGCERTPRPLEAAGTRLSLALPRFAPRSVRLRVAKATADLELPLIEHEPVALDFDTTATSFHGHGGVNFDGRGHSLPGERFPQELRSAGLGFRLGPAVPDASNALACRGQELRLPSGPYDRLTFLAASTSSRGSEIEISGTGVPVARLRVPPYSGFVGQWQRFSGRLGFLLGRFEPGFLERAPVAWICSHRHDRRVHDEVYTHCYLFRFEVPIVPGTLALTLPTTAAVKLFAATASNAGQWLLEDATPGPE